jgi:uncharacterized surface protein with fasciclin (FAS1) repeats
MQNKMVYLYVFALVFCFSIGCSNNESNHKYNESQLKSSPSIISTAKMNASKTIAENILADSSHTILAEALESANLMETLTKPGPFTVFTPDNNAFRKLPEGTLEGWMKTRKNDLVNILSYHIVAGSLKSNDMKDGQKLKTLAGDEIIVTLRKDKLLMNGINVIKPEIQASNGVMYIIDDILFPRNQ